MSTVSKPENGGGRTGGGRRPEVAGGARGGERARGRGVAPARSGASPTLGSGQKIGRSESSPSRPALWSTCQCRRGRRRGGQIWASEASRHFSGVDDGGHEGLRGATRAAGSSFARRARAGTSFWRETKRAAVTRRRTARSRRARRPPAGLGWGAPGGCARRSSRRRGASRRAAREELLLSPRNSATRREIGIEIASRFAAAANRSGLASRCRSRSSACTPRAWATCGTRRTARTC